MRATDTTNEGHCNCRRLGAWMRSNLTTQCYCLTGLLLGGLLVAACTTVTVTNFCSLSELLAFWDRRSSTRATSSTAV